VNQYTQRTVPGAVEVQGAATNTATVTVNLQPTYRKGDYFRAELTADNSASPVYLSVTNIGVRPDWIAGRLKMGAASYAAQCLRQP
jgi:hypothetical protein